MFLRCDGEGGVMVRVVWLFLVVYLIGWGATETTEAKRGSIDGVSRVRFGSRLLDPVPPRICWAVMDVGVGSYQVYEYGEEEDVCVVARQRREQVVQAMKHAWDSYEKYAWGKDELKPLSGTGEDTFNAIALTIIDSMDTLYIMGLEDRYRAAKEYLVSRFEPGEVGVVNVFETTIRVLGGLLAMYHLSGEDEFLDIAEDVGARLGVAFRSPTGIPYPHCSLSTPLCALRAGGGFNSVLAEVGTLQLEFRALGYHARAPAVRNLRTKAERVVDLIRIAADRDPPGLVPQTISIRSGSFTSNVRTFGAPADSYFEYIIKMWIQGGRQEDIYAAIFIAWMKDLEQVVLEISPGMLVVQMKVDQKLYPKMNHFVCFLPGSIFLGIDLARDEKQRELWKKMAEGITATCRTMYTNTKSGLSGEELQLSKGVLRVSGGHRLRPEVVEAIFYMWRWTHDEKYRSWAWDIFSKTEELCRVEKGYAPLANAQSTRPKHDDIMESFFLAETLKYLYLIFSPDDVLPLDKYVFNTEAHPLLVMPSLIDTN